MKKPPICDHKVCSKSTRVDLTAWGLVGAETFCFITRRRVPGSVEPMGRTPRTFKVRCGDQVFTITVTRRKRARR